MQLDPIILRADKGVPLSAEDFDLNMTRFKGGINALFALLGLFLNPNGTIKDGKVGTAALKDRAVTQPKLDWLANFYGVATGTDAYAVTIEPTADFTYGDPDDVDTPTTFLCVVKFTNANTGAATLDVNGQGAKAIHKFGEYELVSDDIKAGLIALLAYDGTQFQLVTSLGSGVDRSELAIVQVAVESTTVTDSTDEIIPDDNTKPQQTEGKEFVTCEFTPLLGDSTLFIEFSSAVYLSDGGNDNDAPIVVALFKDDDDDALAAVGYFVSEGRSVQVELKHKMERVGTTVDPITFKIRYGVQDADEMVHMNAATATARFGGIQEAVLKITELPG